MKTTIFSLMFILAISQIGFAQESNNEQHATLTVKAEYVKYIPSIAEQIANGQFIPAEEINKEVNPKKRGANMAVPGKGLPKGNDPLWKENGSSTKIKGKEPIITWVSAAAGATPTDPTGAIGPSHYVNAWNFAFRIWDKEGNALTSAASLGTIFPGETLGDPIVFYDVFADRFVITEFSGSPSGFLVAVCQGTDPVNDGWYTYRFNSGTFPDYPKFAVWSDGYYITANKDQNSAGTSNVVFAIERDLMLTGDPDAQMVGFPLTGIVTNGFYSPLAFNANGNTLPEIGNAPIIFMQDDSWSGVSEDHLKIWSINVDWDTPANSTISSPQDITTAAFDGLFDGGSFSNLPQSSGPDIDALQATIMYMAQYRRFANYNTVVFNFVIDLDGNDDYAGIRWYELRQDTDGDPWTIFQEGTYAQPDGHSAFSGSMAMDVLGNIGLGYTVVSTTQVPSIRYTGRMKNDPLGEMTLEEDILAAGAQNDPSSRYGDYSQMTIDPSDNKTFWHTGEFFSSGRKNIVGAFKLAPDFATDVGVVSVDAPIDGTLSDSEPITITVTNYGLNEISSTPVSYQVDGGVVVSEMINDAIASGENMQYTFAATADLSTVGTTYEIMTTTVLPGDEDTQNDTMIVSVTYIGPNDLGVTEITSPVSSSGLSNSEPITITINNFGAEPKSDFDVSYTIDDSSPVTEQVAGPLMALSSMSYTFTQTGDFSVLGSYNVSAYTSLAGDLDNSNDTTSAVITNSFCQPHSNCTTGNGFRLFQVGTIDNPSGCEPDGYGDFTFLSTNLNTGSTNDLTVTTGFGNQYVRVWIDYNDNFVFELNELVVDNYKIASGQNAGTYTETMDLVVPSDATLGEHVMRAKSNWINPVPDDACEETTFGETEEYTAVIDFADAVQDHALMDAEMVISYLSGNQFEVSMTTSNFEERLIITVHDVNGRKLIQNWVENENGYFEYEIDMSFVPAGVYLVRLGTEEFGKVKKIVVK